MSNYATKLDIKTISHVDTSSPALKTNLASLKTEADKLGIEKLGPVSVDLNKLSQLVKNVVIKPMYDKLVEKVNNADTSGFVLKTKYEKDKSELGKKISNTNELVRKTNYNNKIAAVGNRIPSISCLFKKTQIITQKLLKFKRNLLIILMTNIFLLQSSIS